jgi:hypothetical protein
LVGIRKAILQGEVSNQVGWPDGRPACRSGKVGVNPIGRRLCVMETFPMYLRPYTHAMVFPTYPQDALLYLNSTAHVISTFSLWST